MTQQLDAKKICHKCSSRALYLENTCQKHYNEQKFWEIQHDLKDVITIYGVRNERKGYTLYYWGAPYKGAEHRLLKVWPSQYTKMAYWVPIKFEPQRGGVFYYKSNGVEVSCSEIVYRLGEHFFSNGLKFRLEYLSL